MFIPQPWSFCGNTIFKNLKSNFPPTVVKYQDVRLWLWLGDTQVRFKAWFQGCARHPHPTIAVHRVSHVVLKFASERKSPVHLDSGQIKPPQDLWIHCRCVRTSRIRTRVRTNSNGTWLRLKICLTYEIPRGLRVWLEFVDGTSYKLIIRSLAPWVEVQGLLGTSICTTRRDKTNLG